MKLEILKEKNVPLLNRKRISAMANFEGGATPTILQFKDAIATQMKIKPELVSVRHVYQRFGSSHAKVIAHIYQSRKELLSLEKIKKAERKAEEGAKKAAEDKAKADAETKKTTEAEKAEAKPEETAPVEVPKEEKPAEVPTEKHKGEKTE